MPVEEEVYAEEVVYGEHQVDDVEEDHPIDGGRLREYSEDEEVEVYGEEETREETVELGYAEEDVVSIDDVEHVEEDHPIDGGRLREYSEDEEVEVYGEEETREETVELGYAEEDVVSIDDVEHVSKEGEVDAEKEFVDE